MKRMIGVFICVFAVLFVITCTDLTNPFLNKADAKAEIIKKNSLNSDTVDIFSTQNLSVYVYLKEHIDSIKVHVDNNRLWNSFDTVVSRPNISESLNLPFSFYTTGKQNIRLISYKNKGDSTVDSCSMYARSPLKQNSISALIGDSVLISTTPVMDRIIYVWDFHNGLVIKELTASALVKITSAFTSHSGELYVVDFANHRSPSVIFQLTNTPVTPNKSLVISCINDSVKVDSVYSQNSELKFSIEVSGAQRLKIATVNGMSFNDSLRMGELFVLNYYLHSLDTIHVPIALTISVIDSLERTVTKTFFVHYIKIDPVINVVYPVEDSMPTAATMVNVLGNISNNQQYDSLYVFARNNGKVLGKICVTQKKPVFSFEIPLTSSSNHIALELYSDSLMVGSLLSLSQFYVLYNPAHIDTLPPQIRNIRCNGGPVDSVFISRISAMRLEIDAVDNSNKVTVKVNGEKIEKGADELFFTTNMVLTHKKDSTVIAVNATDSSGYSVNDSVYVYYNRLPQWIKTPSYSVITAGEESEFLLSAADPDNDALFITMTIKRQSGDSLFNASNGHVVWHPQIADTGEYLVELTAWDGYEPIDTNFTIVVKRNGLSAVPVKLLKENIDFPDTLFIGDSLHAALREVPLTGSRPFSYAAYFVNDKSKIILNGPDSVVLWAPAITDTGMRTLRVVIKDSLNYKDSMDVDIRVMKRILAHLKWKQNSSQFSEGGLENSFPRVIMNPSLNFGVTIPYSITFPSGDKSANSSDIKSPISGTISFDGKDDTLASILLSIVDDSIPEGTEKFEIRLSDNDSIKLCDSCNNVFYGEIIDNDLVTFYYEETEAEGAEKIGTVTATVKLSKPFQTALELSYEVDTVNSSAKISQDFELIGSSQKLTFDPGKTQARINLSIVNDKVKEVNETIILKLHSENEFAKPKDSVNFIYTIMNDDSAAHYSFTAAEASGSEGDSVITIKVNLDKKVDFPVVIKYSLDSDPSKTTATDGTDFKIIENADSILFNAGDTSKLIKIAIEDDTLPEINDEFFTLNLRSDNTFTSQGHFTSCKYTILKNEVGVFFASPTQSGDEEYVRNPYCEMMLTAPLKDSLIVHFIVDARTTADSVSDFTIREPGIVIFRPGETRKDLGITIVDDEKPEQTEHLYLKITEVSDLKRAYIRTDNTTNILIQSN